MSAVRQSREFRRNCWRFSCEIWPMETTDRRMQSVPFGTPRSVGLLGLPEPPRNTGEVVPFSVCCGYQKENDCISVKTLRGFLDGVASLYAKAKKPLSRLVDKRVVKGRAKCVASQAEELFADFICKSILRTKKGYKVFVDFPITVRPGRDGKKVRLDILISYLLESQRVISMRFCIWPN